MTVEQQTLLESPMGNTAFAMMLVRTSLFAPNTQARTLARQLLDALSEAGLDYRLCSHSVCAASRTGQRRGLRPLV